MTSDKFVDKVQRELRSLARHEEDLAKRYEQLQRDRTATRNRTAELTRLLAVYQEMLGLEPTDDESGEETVIAERVDGPKQITADFDPVRPIAAPIETNGATAPTATTADLAAAFMAARGGHAKVGDILDELIRVGKLAGKSGDYGSVFGTLKRNPKRFVQVGKGEFGLLGEGSADGGPR